jgi:hypothetical protein
MIYIRRAIDRRTLFVPSIFYVTWKVPAPKNSTRFDVVAARLGAAEAVVITVNDGLRRRLGSYGGMLARARFEVAPYNSIMTWI